MFFVPGQTIDLLDGNLIDLIVDIETGDVDSASDNHINELVNPEMVSSYRNERQTYVASSLKTTSALKILYS